MASAVGGDAVALREGRVDIRDVNDKVSTNGDLVFSGSKMYGGRSLLERARERRENGLRRRMEDQSAS